MPLFLFQSHYQNFNPTLCQPIPLFLVYIYYPTITLLVYTLFEYPTVKAQITLHATNVPPIVFNALIFF